MNANSQYEAHCEQVSAALSFSWAEHWKVGSGWDEKSMGVEASFFASRALKMGQCQLPNKEMKEIFHSVECDIISYLEF